MTPLVSTYESNSGRDLWFDALTGAAVQGGVVGCAVLPASPHDPHPGSGQDAGGMRVVLARGPRPVVDVSGPGTGKTTVRGEGCDGHAQAFVAGPAEGHAALFAGCLGDRGDSGQCSDRVGMVEHLAGIAPLGQNLAGVDRARTREGAEDRP